MLEIEGNGVEATYGLENALLRVNTSEEAIHNNPVIQQLIDQSINHTMNGETFCVRVIDEAGRSWVDLVGIVVDVDRTQEIAEISLKLTSSPKISGIRHRSV